MNTDALAGLCSAGISHQLAEERSLWESRDTDPRAREELTNRYLPFARRLAGHYRNNLESFDDLFQVASVGLVNAINRYDPTNGTPFRAFAAPTIHGELKRYFRDRIWLVKVPRGLQEEIQTLDATTDELSAELHRAPTDSEIGARSNLGENQIDRARSAKSNRVPTSMDLPVDEEGNSRGERCGSTDPGFRLVEDSDEIRRAMETLGDTERLVLRLRFIDEMTQAEIAERIGFSQMHVSRLIRRSITAVTAFMEEQAY